MKKISYFVTGIDTEIGKTTISCAILRSLKSKGVKVAPMKPVAAGATIVDGIKHNEDVDALIDASSTDMSRELVCPYLLNTPASPHLAARIDGVEINLDYILECYSSLVKENQAVIVEGVGGFMVPFSDTLGSEQLAVALNLPVIMVVAIRLGCINHALLTAKAIEQSGLKLAGWVANCKNPDMLLLDENVQAIQQRIKAPLLGKIPYLKTFDQACTWLHLEKLPDWPSQLVTAKDESCHNQ